MSAWSDRPLEERTLFNPAFLVLILYEAARGHQEECEAPLAFPLSFLTVALATHDGIVGSLPRSIRTSMLTWVNREPLARVQVGARARELVPATREAMRIGSATGALLIDSSGGISAGSLGRLDREARQLRSGANLKGSLFIGRWLAKVGDPVTSLAAWGLMV